MLEEEYLQRYTASETSATSNTSPEVWCEDLAAIIIKDNAIANAADNAAFD